MVADIIRVRGTMLDKSYGLYNQFFLQGMLYLQDSPLRYHGALSTSNCLIDSRWVVKLSDFGLQAFKQGIEETNDIQTMNAKCLSNFHCNCIV